MWSDLSYIKSELQKKWDSGRILRNLIGADDLFPLKIPLKKPSPDEMGRSFAEVLQWIKLLRESSKSVLGRGYELVEKEINHRQLGRNKVPTHAIVPTVEDAVFLLKKKRDAEKYTGLSQQIRKSYPQLREWVLKYPHKVLDNAGEWGSLIKVLDWFYAHPKSDLYIRQVDIPGIDTKYIEKRKSILTELLGAVMPEDNNDKNVSNFEKCFGLRSKPTRVRFRLLHKSLYINGFSDLTVSINELCAYEPAVINVFITENEINGLCLPEMSESLVIFGLGYGVDILKEVAWLREKNVYYWGDIDTHGFAMLDQVRSFLPQTKSFLMHEEILLKTHELWSREEKQFPGDLSRLSSDEESLFRALKHNIYGEKVRLEQERISFHFVQNELDI